MNNDGGLRLWKGEQHGVQARIVGAGERPLFDFESGLYRRERMSCLLSKHLGFCRRPHSGGSHRHAVPVAAHLVRVCCSAKKWAEFD